ncbi:hypothetical protein Tco_1254096 [Tanacetum coccineum]
MSDVRCRTQLAAQTTRYLVKLPEPTKTVVSDQVSVPNVLLKLSLFASSDQISVTELSLNSHKTCMCRCESCVWLLNLRVRVALNDGSIVYTDLRFSSWLDYCIAMDVEISFEISVLSSACWICSRCCISIYLESVDYRRSWSSPIMWKSLEDVINEREISFGEAYQFFEDMLKVFDREDLVKLWSLVKERFSSTEPTDDKERILWVELKRLFEPNTDDTLWKLQRYMHDLWKLRLYNTCGVHHLSTERGMDTFMLVEKEYPLSKGVLMLVNKLLVEQSSKMENELL